MFERFTDRARRVLVLAQEEARLLNHNFIGTEHLLLGLLRESDGVAARALELLGIRLQVVREKVEETVGPAGVEVASSPPFTPRAKKVMEFSLREALQLGHNYIGTEHLLLGLVREGEGVAAQVLVSLGADLASVRKQVVLLVTGSSAQGATAAQGQRGVTGAPVAPGPRCARCGAGLAGFVRYATLEALPGDEEAGAASGPFSVTVLYCAHCGGVLVPARETGEEPGRPRPAPRSVQMGGPGHGGATSSGHGVATTPSAKVPSDPLGPVGLESVPDEARVELVYHDSGVIDGTVGGTRVHLRGLVPTRQGSADGTWGGSTFEAEWSIGDTRHDNANPCPVVVSGRFGVAPVKLEGEFRLSADRSLEGARLAGDLGGQDIGGEVSPADGGLGTTSAVVAEGTLGGAPFELFAAFSDDSKKAVVRGSIGGWPVAIDANRAGPTAPARIVGSYSGEPALLVLVLAVAVRFL